MKKLLSALILTAMMALLACAECPASPTDEQVKDLVGKACSPEAAVCASNNGCGGCSVTCTNGEWTSTDSTLCFSIGRGC